MLDDHQCPALGEATNQRNCPLRLRVAHACGRLVQQDDVGAAGNGDADLQRALFGICQQPGRYVAACSEADVREHLRRSVADLRQIVDVLPERVTMAVGPEHGATQIFPHAHVGEHIGDLEAARQAAAIDLIGRQTGNHLSAKRDRSRRRPDVAADEIERCRFARTIGADERVPFALCHAQVQVADDRDIAEAFLDVPHFDGGRGHAWYPLSCAAVSASSQARASLRQVSRATTNPPTIRNRAMIHVIGLDALKFIPKALIFGSSPGFTV